MAKKKKAREMSTEEMEEAGIVMGEEIRIDLERGTQTLSDEEQEIIQKARNGLWQLMDLITASVPPEPSEEHLEYVHKMCKSGLYFRNVIRGTFLQSEGHELPEEWHLTKRTMH